MHVAAQFQPKCSLMTTLQTVLDKMRQGLWRDAHNLVQDDHSLQAAWLHGILHIQEGDLEDAQYWYEQAQRNFRERGTLAEEIERFEVSLKAS
jgi:hypothetical protein